MLGLQLLSHGEGHGTLVEGLISRDGHLDFVTDSKQKKTSFGLRKGDLSDDLIEALREKLLSNWTNAALTSLSFHEFLIKLFSQSSNINTGSWLVGNILNVVLSVLNPLSGRKNSVQDVFTGGLGVHGRQLLFLGT